MQLVDQKTKCLISFIRCLQSKTLKTLILDTFANENIIKPTVFQHFDIFGRKHNKTINESNQWIESMNRINESNQWIESVNRISESNQWIESVNRISESNQWSTKPPSVRALCWDNFLICLILIMLFRFSYFFLEKYTKNIGSV